MGPKVRDFTAAALKRIFGFLEFFLFLRIVLEFLGANPAAAAVKYFYDGTGFFTAPFNTIFPAIQWLGRTVDLVTFSAIIAYWILYEILMKLLLPKRVYY